MSAAPVPRLAALGDSLFAGFGLAPKDALPAVLQRLLSDEGAPAEVLNFGVSGDTARDGLARLNRVLAARPHGLLVEFGTNDFFLGLDPARVEAALDAILERAGQAGLPVLLVGAKSEGLADEAYARAFDAVHPRVAGRHGALLFPDILACFLPGRGAPGELTLLDGLHPNANGARRAAEALLPQTMELADLARKTLAFRPGEA